MIPKVIRPLYLVLVTVGGVLFANVTKNIEMGDCLGLRKPDFSSNEALRRINDRR